MVRHFRAGWVRFLRLGHLSITVNAADRERAEEIIKAYERGDFALGDED